MANEPRQANNLGLVNHLRQQRQWRSRYEIDLELLNEGHAPEELEAAWQTVLSEPELPLPPAPASRNPLQDNPARVPLTLYLGWLVVLVFIYRQLVSGNLAGAAHFWERAGYGGAVLLPALGLALASYYQLKHSSWANIARNRLILLLAIPGVAFLMLLISS